MLVVEEAVKVSLAGRAAKQGAALFALAMVAQLGDAAAKKAAIASLPKVCRTASTLYEWHTYHKVCSSVKPSPCQSQCYELRVFCPNVCLRYFTIDFARSRVEQILAKKAISAMALTMHRRNKRTSCELSQISENFDSNCSQ